jgi:hypothetical protein
MRQGSLTHGQNLLERKMNTAVPPTGLRPRKTCRTRSHFSLVTDSLTLLPLPPRTPTHLLRLSDHLDHRSSLQYILEQG